MDKDERKKTTVEEKPGEKKTTEETHKPGQPAQPGKPSQDKTTTTVEK